MAEFRRRVETATLVATGSEGPLRVALDGLRRVGLGERVVKTALAAGTAWAIGHAIHADPLPVLAPLTAIFTIQLTLAMSLQRSIQRVLGVILGVAVSLLAQALFGVNAVTIAIVVTVAITAGLRLGLDPSGVEQMTVSALLVLIAGSSFRQPDVFALLHIVDTLVGTAVGLAMNWLIAPPSYVGNARVAVGTLGGRLVATQEELAAALAEGVTPETAAIALEQARSVGRELLVTQAALDRAEESLVYNLTGKRQRPALQRFQRANRALEHAAVQTRVIARTVSDAAGEEPAWFEPGALGMPLANLFSAIAHYLDHFLALAANPGEAPEDAPLAAEMAGRRAEVGRVAREHQAVLAEGGWVLLGEIISISDQLVTDLTAAAAELG